MRNRLLIASAVLELALLSAHASQAQQFRTQECQPSNSGDSSGFLSSLFDSLSTQERACEVRSATLPLVGGQVQVVGHNGGIAVSGEDRQDIALEARVEAHAHSQADAASLLHQVRIVTSGAITAEGPSHSGANGWSVSYRLRVPRHVAAQLKTENGSIELTSLEGNIQAGTTNGSLSLRDLAGDVEASTTNGGASIALSGETWRGRGLSVQSTNGGLEIEMPGSYSAHLVAQTTNGSISGGVGDQATGRRHNSLDTTVGHGGPTLDFATTNGGISLTTR